MTRDIPASVRGQLENLARKSGRPLQELMQYFVMERFLFRLSQSEYVDRFVLKGALMFTVHGLGIHLQMWYVRFKFFCYH